MLQYIMEHITGNKGKTDYWNSAKNSSLTGVSCLYYV